MVYGLARVSSKKQEKEGNSLKQQEDQIISRYENAIVIKEQYTAKTMDRPVLNELLKKLQENDVLVVTKLDRLSRTVVEGIQIIQELFKRKISVHVLNIGLLEDTTMGRFFLTTLLAVAEMERETIIERMQAGKEIARLKKNYKEGRPKKFKFKQIELALSLLKNNSYTEVEKMTGISKSTLYRESVKLKNMDKGFNF